MSISLEQVIKLSKSDRSQMELIYDGRQEQNNSPRSNVYRIGKYCVKYYIRCRTDFRTEVRNLKILESYEFAPKLFYSDENELFIIMEYIEGVRLGKYGNLNSNQQKNFQI